MKSLSMLIKRNILIYIKDKSSVFFSLLSMIIIIVLNSVFLGKTNVDSILNIVSIDEEKAKILVYSMVMAGIIVVNATTVTLGVTGMMVRDEENNKLKSFYISPVSRINIILGYIISSFIIGCIFCFITFFISEMYIHLIGGEILTINNIIKVSLFIIVNVFSASCFVFFITSLLHTSSAFSSVTVIIGTLVGFVGGLYIPIGELPEIIQKVIKCCPIIYGTSLMKGIFIEKPLIEVFTNTDLNVINSYKEYLAISLTWNDEIVSEISKIGVLTFSGVIFLILSMIILKNKKIKDR